MVNNERLLAEEGIDDAETTTTTTTTTTAYLISVKVHDPVVRVDRASEGNDDGVCIGACWDVAHVAQDLRRVVIDRAERNKRRVKALGAIPGSKLRRRTVGGKHVVYQILAVRHIERD